jgi:hypothetical protein
MLNFLAQTYDYTTSTTSSSSGFNPVVSILYLAVVVLLIVSMWKVFEKAGEAGWKAIIPVYNTYITIKLAGRPGWWLLLMFIPLVSLVVGIMVMIDLAKCFGKSTAFGVFGLFFFSFVGYPMLAFGDAKYTPPTGGPSAGAAPVSTPPAAA